MLLLRIAAYATKITKIVGIREPTLPWGLAAQTAKRSSSVARKDAGTRWLDMAESAIDTAREIKDATAKVQLLVIAKAYLHLAKHAREQAELRRKSRIKILD